MERGGVERGPFPRSLAIGVRDVRDVLPSNPVGFVSHVRVREDQRVDLDPMDSTPSSFEVPAVTAAAASATTDCRAISDAACGVCESAADGPDISCRW